MARASTKRAPAAEAKPKKAKASSGGGKKKMSAYNKYMATEMARLREEEPQVAGKDRFLKATANWKTAKENPKAA